MIKTSTIQDPQLVFKEGSDDYEASKPNSQHMLTKVSVKVFSYPNLGFFFIRLNRLG